MPFVGAMPGGALDMSVLRFFPMLCSRFRLRFGSHAVAPGESFRRSSPKSAALAPARRARALCRAQGRGLGALFFGVREPLLLARVADAGGEAAECGGGRLCDGGHGRVPFFG